MTKGNRVGTLMPDSLSTKLNRITRTARECSNYQFRTLAHLINVEMLRRAFFSLRKNASAGIDGITFEEYSKNLAENLTDLHHRMKAKRYRAQPLRRAYIRKEDGKQRPLAIPALEDKIVQRAVVWIIGRIFEEDFLDCSYGYRPRKSAHEAIRAVRERINFEGVKYVVEADIQNYFGCIVREKLEEMLKKRILDRNIMRLIGKWLRMGVIEDGKLLITKEGIHQGSIISPLLANVYLHVVLDEWFELTVKPLMKKEATMYRFADDFVATFQCMSDAERFINVLPRRFKKYGLILHPKKTRLLEFGRYPMIDAQRKGKSLSTFSFLGFTFYWGKTRNGKLSVKVKTKSKKLQKALKRVAIWCKKNRHETIKTQWEHLCAVLRGHYQYYGEIGNSRSLARFQYGVNRAWQKWLNRRDNQYNMPWDRFSRVVSKNYPLPLPKMKKESVQLMLPR